MKNKKKDLFKKIIRQAEADKPPIDFTDLVMEEVMAEARQETVINPALKSLLKRQAVENPSANFTTNVMAALDLSSQIAVNKPVITKKAGYVIASVVILLVVLLFLEGVSKSMPRSVGYGDKLGDILKYITSISPLCFITLIMVSVLLLIDYFINNKSVQKLTND